MQPLLSGGRRPEHAFQQVSKLAELLEILPVGRRRRGLGASPACDRAAVRADRGADFGVVELQLVLRPVDGIAGKFEREGVPEMQVRLACCGQRNVLTERSTEIGDPSQEKPPLILIPERPGAGGGKADVVGPGGADCQLLEVPGASLGRRVQRAVSLIATSPSSNRELAA